MKVMSTLFGSPWRSGFEGFSQDGGPYEAHGVEVDSLALNLNRAAVFAKSMYGVGNGRYTAHRSSLASVFKDLRGSRYLNVGQAEDLLNRLDEIPDSKWTKYQGPLKEIRRRVRDVSYSLRGTESPENQENRTLFENFLATISPQDRALDSGDEQVVAAYKEAGGYQDLNRALRGQRALTEGLRGDAEALCAGLTKLPPYTKVVYRGAGCLLGGVKEAEVGAVYTEPGFLSTSETPEKAFGGEFRLAIVPRVSFFDISDICDPGDCNSINLSHFEGEVLGFPGTSFVYEGFHDGFHWYREVEVEEVSYNIRSSQRRPVPGRGR